MTSSLLFLSLLTSSPIYAQAVRQDPDLQPLRESEEFPALINKYDEPLFDENVIKAFKNMFGFMKK